DFVPNEFGITRRQFGLDEGDELFLLLVGELLTLDRLFQHIHEMDRIGRDFLRVEIEGVDRTLKAKRVERPSIPSSTPAASRYSCTVLARGSLSFSDSPS